MIINGREYTEKDITRLFNSVTNVLTVDEEEIRDANCGLFETALDIGLVTEAECNFG